MPEQPLSCHVVRVMKPARWGYYITILLLHQWCILLSSVLVLVDEAYYSLIVHYKHSELFSWFSGKITRQVVKLLLISLGFYVDMIVCEEAVYDMEEYTPWHSYVFN